MTSIEWRELGHRWFVQYNPLYLVSAGCVLLGLHLVSAGLSRGDGLLATLVVSALTEVYQLLLIGAAALLVRLGRRRPAVMLALIEVCYLCDLTLQNGVAAMLGGVGVAVSAAWLLLALAKVRALAWALRLRLSLSAWLLAGGGALALAAFPHLLFSRVLSTPGASATLGWLAFALGAAGLCARREATCKDELDDWGSLVLRRALRATWLIWAALGTAHLGFWSLEAGLAPAQPLLTALGLLAASRARREGQAWLLLLGALGASALLQPQLLSSTALMCAAALVLRGVLHRPRLAPAVEASALAHPYRAASTAAPTSAQPRARAPWRPEARRCYVGALVLVHLALWALAWEGGPWPRHLLWLDVLFSIPLALAAWRGRVRCALLPLLAGWAHFALERGLLGAPRTALGWGGLLLGVGFALLVVGVALSWLLAREPRRNKPGWDEAPTQG